MVDPHPYYPHHYHYRRYWVSGYRPSFFSRVFWFALGAGAATYWIRKKDEERRTIMNSGMPGDDGTNTSPNGWPIPWSCKRREMSDRWNQMQAPTHVPPTQQQYESRYQVQGGRGWNGTDGLIPGAVATATSVDNQNVPIQDCNIDVSHDGAKHVPTGVKIKEVGRHAGDAMTEISEQALDTLIGSIVALKNKLAEVRQEREKMYLEQRLQTPEGKGGPQPRRRDNGDSKLNVFREDDDVAEPRRVA